MKIWKWLIIGGTLAVILAAAYFFWQRPQPVEMARYVPAETLVYLEVNNLPAVFKSLTETNAWQALAPRYGVEKDFGDYGWISQTLAEANLGSTQSVVFGRSQIAVALMSLAATDAGESLKIRPQFAVVIETKSSRAGQFVETEVSDFARRAFSDFRIEKKESDNAAWTIFRAVADERNLFAAVAGTTIVIGNDEAAVKACLDTKSGRRQSLGENPDLAKMRANTESETALAFGFVTPSGITQLSSVGAILAAGQMVEDPRAMSLLAQALPPFVQKSVEGIGWTARKGLRNKTEDRYLLQMPMDLVARLREPLADNASEKNELASILPADLQSVTFYHLRNPQTAWRGVIFAMTTKLDAFSAAAFSQGSAGLLEPYGIEKANDFIGATDGTIATAQLSNMQDATVAASGVKDIEALKKTLQTNGARESEFIGDAVLLGTAQSLQICRHAREQNRTLATEPIWVEFSDTKPTPKGTFVRTLRRDELTPTSFVKLFSKDNAVRPVGETTAPNWVWTITETRLVREGVERRTTSPFGLVGTLATSFAEN